MDTFSPTTDIGPTVVGTFVTFLLFGCLLVQTYAYTIQFGSKDPWFLKGLVILIVGLELGHLVSGAIGVWDMTIGTLVAMGQALNEAMKDPAQIANGGGLSETFSVGASVASIWGPIIAFFVRLFFLYRFRRFSGAWILPGLCAALSIAHLGLGLAVWPLTLSATNAEAFRDDNHGKIIALLIVELLADTSITMGLSYYLWRTGSDMGKNHATSVMIKRLILWTIEVGMITTLTDLSIIATFVAMPSNFVWTGLYSYQPAIYANSLLTALNSRTDIHRLNPDVYVEDKSWHPSRSKGLSSTSGSTTLPPIQFSPPQNETRRQSEIGMKSMSYDLI
ncbi:hypothetical protein CONPUDRAFT_138030 [Coniophora puteana RWD-64-598 SS2]|uniref:DUF6534 domain-containing protein n=1 Tax=Coniophora puteana (strain RWD-64-598) TaxID=741705 RepID=A0A5M3MLC4_CONPW|nr:uncharacterized protein CONPUDRAFT_138030 [Coniophora puteana RWD-64-598 SS2]EIW79827.1 hypothetical protein CONPUDRAFT_138030 [Coniophora puteana RWD-64-598 SS2]